MHCDGSVRQFDPQKRMASSYLKQSLRIAKSQNQVALNIRLSWHLSNPFPRKHAGTAYLNTWLWREDFQLLRDARESAWKSRSVTCSPTPRAQGSQSTTIPQWWTASQELYIFQRSRRVATRCTDTLRISFPTNLGVFFTYTKSP